MGGGGQAGGLDRESNQASTAHEALTEAGPGLAGRRGGRYSAPEPPSRGQPGPQPSFPGLSAASTHPLRSRPCPSREAPGGFPRRSRATDSPAHLGFLKTELLLGTQESFPCSRETRVVGGGCALLLAPPPPTEQHRGVSRVLRAGRGSNSCGGRGGGGAEQTGREGPGLGRLGRPGRPRSLLETQHQTHTPQAERPQPLFLIVKVMSADCSKQNKTEKDNEDSKTATPPRTEITSITIRYITSGYIRS